MSSRMNWNAAASRDRIQKHGSENASGATSARPGRKTDRRQTRPAGPRLDEPVIVAKWWKNRSGDAIYVRLSTYEDHNLIDIRTWSTGTDGISRPGKGFAASVKHLPQLVEAIGKALTKARELGLIDGEEGGS